MKEDKTRTKSGTNSKPSKKFRRFIKITNLVPFNADINFDFMLYDLNLDFNQRMLFFYDQIAKHNLERFPKLVRYLSYVAKKHYGGWEFDLEEIKKVRDFTKVLVEIAEKYQNECKKRDKHKSLLETLKYNNADHSSEIISFIDILKNHKDFKVSNDSAEKPDLLGSLKSDELKADEIEKNNLGRRLFEIALSSFVLTVDNHSVQISKGNLLDSIEGIDLRRLKKCIICSKVIWAYRLNAKFCSKKCSNVYHQRLYQTENRETINLKRRENYQYKRRKKKNDTL